MVAYTIPHFDSHLIAVNRARAENGQNPVKMKDWSAFLSGISSATVRKAWIDAMRASEGLPEDKALHVLSALNAALKQVGLATVKASELESLETARG